MSDVDVVRDLHGVLAEVQQGIEVIIEQDHRAVAVLHSPPGKGRLLSECIALAEARSPTAVADEGFLQDVMQGIAERSQPWNPPTSE